MIWTNTTTIFDYMLYSYQNYMVGSGSFATNLTGLLILAVFVIISLAFRLPSPLLSFLLIPMGVAMIIFHYLSPIVGGAIILISVVIFTISIMRE